MADFDLILVVTYQWGASMAQPMSNGTRPLNAGQIRWSITILLTTYFAYGGYYLTRKVFTICKTSIAEDFGWQLSDTKWIWGSFLIAYAIGQILNSFIGRKWGPRLLLVGGLGISIVINVIFGFANSFSTFVVFMFFNGLVQASGWPGAVGGIAHWLRPSQRGLIMGFWSTSYLVGNIVVKSLGGTLLEAYGWRYSFWGLTLLGFGVWWIVFLFQRNKPQDVGLEPIVDKSSEDLRSIRVAEEDQVTFYEYLRLARNPVILIMGVSYFCIKFLRYAIDSWLPAFLDIQGFSKADASHYSMIFDVAGFAGAVLAGYALDKIFRGNWAALCFIMGLGMIVGYVAVIVYGTSPLWMAICFGLVGFMLYGPDTLLCGAASVTVAGEQNGVAVAGLVNGIASVGPILQELVIGELIEGDKTEEIVKGISKANTLALSMSVLFTVFMLFMMWWLRRTHRRHMEADARLSKDSGT